MRVFYEQLKSQFVYKLEFVDRLCEIYLHSMMLPDVAGGGGPMLS